MGIIDDPVTNFMVFQTVDLRLSQQFYSSDGERVSGSAGVFNLFSWYNTHSYGGTQHTATGANVASYGRPTGAHAARQRQAGLRIDW
ncbi:MAG: hypothetical protein ACYC3F_13140 [Gemmatimonadaceae bacterium]